jgi:hypothetical protein
LTTLWAFGYSHLVVNARTTVRNGTELAACARENLRDIQTLFDNGMLESWAQGQVRLELAALAREVGAATERLAALPLTADAGPPWLGSLLGEQAPLLVNAAEDWLLVTNRAALAVAAFGGVLERRRQLPSEQRVEGMPLDSDLRLAVALGPATVGDVPTHAIIRTKSDRLPRAAIVRSDASDDPVVYFEAAEIDALGQRWTVSVEVLQVQVGGTVESTPIQFTVAMSGTSIRLERGLTLGGRLAFAGALVGGLIGSAYGALILTMLPSLIGKSPGFRDISLRDPDHGFLGLLTGIVALLPLYLLWRFGRRPKPVSPAPTQPAPKVDRASTFSLGLLAFFVVGALGIGILPAIGEVGSYALWSAGHAASRFLPSVENPAFLGLVVTLAGTGALVGHLIGMLRARATGYAFGSALAGIVFLAGLTGLF